MGAPQSAEGGALQVTLKRDALLSNNLNIGGPILKIQVESLGLPTLSKLIGKKTEMEMADGTLADLIAHIVNRSGREARKVLLDHTGELDMTIQVMLNDEGFVPRNELSQRTLKDGDSVKIMLLVGGG
jgi:sulfur carrier protein ThiS